MDFMEERLKKNVLNDPEYKRYCKYYFIEEVEDEKNIIMFLTWKCLGMSL